MYCSLHEADSVLPLCRRRWHGCRTRLICRMGWRRRGWMDGTPPPSCNPPSPLPSQCLGSTGCMSSATEWLLPSARYTPYLHTKYSPLIVHYVARLSHARSPDKESGFSYHLCTSHSASRLSSSNATHSVCGVVGGCASRPCFK